MHYSGKIVGFIPVSGILELDKMQTAPSEIELGTPNPFPPTLTVTIRALLEMLVRNLTRRKTSAKSPFEKAIRKQTTPSKIYYGKSHFTVKSKDQRSPQRTQNFQFH